MAQGGGLSRKVGPLPAWGWGTVVIGGILVALYLRKRAAASSASQAVSAPTDTSGTVSSPTTTPSVVDTSGAAPASAPPAFDAGSAFDSLLGAFENNVNAVTGLAAQTNAEGILAQQQSFDFAQSVFGSALDFAKSSPWATPTLPSSPGPQTTSTPKVPSVPAAPTTAGQFGNPYESLQAAQAALAAGRAPAGGF